MAAAPGAPPLASAWHRPSRVARHVEVVMLVLRRRVGESVVVGGDVVVTVLEVRGEVVRLGIDAPRDVVVHRSEVVEAIAAVERDVDAG